MSQDSKSTFNSNDFFYDIESLSNIFTCAIYYPKRTLLEFYFLEDGDVFCYNPEFIQKVKQHILDKNPNFKSKDDPQIMIYDLKMHDGFFRFLKLFGLGTNQEKRWDYSLYDDALYPVKDTDTDIYDPEIHGRAFGYNSTNYDLTMLAWYFYNTCDYFLKKSKGNADDFKKLTAKEIRNFNNLLFEDENKRQMPKVLAKELTDSANNWDDEWNWQVIGLDQENYNRTPWKIRKSWLLTGRFIDIARLNDHMRTVGLKRLLGMLGHQILESENLTGKAEINSVEEMLDLFAYNTSDVVNSEQLLMNNVYQSSYKNKMQLLSEYPELIYKESTTEKYKPDINPEKVRRDRLCVDSSSAKFVEMVLCPYGKGLNDIEAVSYEYPAKSVCDRLGIEKPFNVLEETKKWFEKNVGGPGTPQHDKFMRIYNFYKEIEGQNFNSSERYENKYRDDDRILPVRDKKWVRKLMNEYNTNLFYFDADGNETDCFVTFSVGGIHGQEVNRKAFDKKYEEYKKEQDLLDWVKEQYNGDPMEAVNGPVRITLPDGREEKIRAFLKSGSTKKKAEWRTIRKPELFKIDIDGNINLDKEYVYTSIGPANHEDFTSYYPLLLCNLAAFNNEALGEDRYYSLFLDRKKFKTMAKDKSYDKEEREMFGLIQEGKKLLLNSASGAGDASFDSNIRMNNRTISMRIIG